MAIKKTFTLGSIPPRGCLCLSRCVGRRVHVVCCARESGRTGGGYRRILAKCGAPCARNGRL